MADDNPYGKPVTEVTLIDAWSKCHQTQIALANVLNPPGGMGKVVTQQVMNQRLIDCVQTQHMMLAKLFEAVLSGRA